MKNHNTRLWKEVQNAIINAGFPLPRYGADGVPGEETANAMLALTAAYSNRNPIPVPIPDDVEIPTAIDTQTAKNIGTLLPAVQPTFLQLALLGKEVAAAQDLDYRMISGTRSYEEQNKLYAKGRSAPGPKVTNVRGGYSRHNFGIAGDFGVFDKEGQYLDSGNPPLASQIHQAVAEEVKARKMNIEWGGDWSSFVDEPHFQYKTGLSTRQMRERKAAGIPIV
jgi:peptidoglycan L-alanyl-D-glutamate endopeptidase CwlK